MAILHLLKGILLSTVLHMDNSLFMDSLPCMGSNQGMELLLQQAFSPHLQVVLRHYHLGTRCRSHKGSISLHLHLPLATTSDTIH